jgi:hypothetical protein
VKKERNKEEGVREREYFLEKNVSKAHITYRTSRD